MRRHSITTLAIFVFAALPVSAACPPNVVIPADDLGYGDLGRHGPPTTG